MNATIFRRLVWKEYRMQRAFWLAMVALAVFLQLLLLMSASFVDDSRWAADGAARIGMLFGLAMALPAFYALGCGATMFATEHETGTFQFQRMLPVSASRLFFGKLAFALVSIALMFAVLWPVALMLSGGRLPDVETQLGLWSLWGFGAVELLVWGVFFSLLSSHPLKATVMAVTAASFSVHFTTAGYIDSGNDYFKVVSYWSALSGRIGVLSFVAAADVFLGVCWFRDRSSGLRGSLGLRPRAVDSGTTTAADAELSGDTGFTRLVWQSWRQSGSMVLALAAMIGPFILLTVGKTIYKLAAGLTRDPRIDGFWFGIFLFLAFAAAPMAGVCVFLADQRRQGFRFLTDRGVRPGLVWLSRQVIWLPVALVSGSLVLGGWMALKYDHLRGLSDREWTLLFGLSAVYVLLAYTCGQLFSMLFRSGILAGALSIALTGVVCGWVGLMWFLGVPLIWSAVPIPLVLLAATWVRTPGWMLERGGFKAWLAPALVLVVPAVALLVAIPCYRLYQIPLFDPGFSVEEFSRPQTAEEKVAVDTYRRAWETLNALGGHREMGLSDEDRRKAKFAWVDDNRNSIAFALEASEMTGSCFFDPVNSDPVRWRLRELGDLVIASGQKLESEGNLDEALDRYLAALRMSIHARSRAEWGWAGRDVEASVCRRLPEWAACLGQTPKRIATAIRRFDEVAQQIPSPRDGLKARHVVTQHLIDADPEAMASCGIKERSAMALAFWSKWLPWERGRTIRELNGLTSRDLTQWKFIERSAREGERIFVLEQPDWEELQWSHRLNPVWKERYWTGFDMAPAYVNLLTGRRATRLLLALQAFRLEHGRLPELLDELVGPYLDEVPIDPCSGEPFHYFADGLPIPLTRASGDVSYKPELEVMVEADRPFIWSAGTGVNVRHGGSKFRNRCRIKYANQNDWVDPVSEYIIWQHGRPFPLPEAAGDNDKKLSLSHREHPPGPG